MKKLISSLSVVLLSVFFVISCSKEENIEKNQEVLNSKLLNELSNFNQTNSLNTNNTLSKARPCKGFWGCLGYVSMVAGADIIGAGAGVTSVSGAAAALGVATGGTGAIVVMSGAGVVCGAGASYAAGRSYDPTYLNQTLNYGQLNIIVPEEFIEFSNVGIDHNKVIHNNFYNNTPIQNYYNSNFDIKQTEILNSSNFINTTQIVKNASVEYVRNNFDYKTFTQKMLNEKYFTINMKGVMDLFLEKYFTCKEDTDFQEVINYYIDVISNSELKKLEKQALIASFMVASESPFYFYNDK